MYLGTSPLFSERFIRKKRVWFLIFIHLLRSKNCQMRTLVQRIWFWGVKLFTGASTEPPILVDGFSNFTVGDYHCAILYHFQRTRAVHCSQPTNEATSSCITERFCWCDRFRKPAVLAVVTKGRHYDSRALLRKKSLGLVYTGDNSV